MHKPGMDQNNAAMRPSSATLSSLPAELLLQIMSHLDIPDLLALSRTSHHLRTLSLDPLLHALRLRRASFTLLSYIPLRPPLTQLMHQRIYITRTTLAARNLGRSLIKIKLNRKLGRRPSAGELVELGVLPGECYNKGGKGMVMAPGLVETKRKIERERVKDILRHWVEEWRRKGEGKADGQVGERPGVRRLARRFGREEKREVGQRWAAPEKGRREDPTRAKVLGLRRFWEKVGREGGIV
jgi:hypothetical protein